MGINNDVFPYQIHLSHLIITNRPAQTMRISVRVNVGSTEKSLHTKNMS